MEQKKSRFNVIDVIAVVLIVAVLGFVGYKLANRGSGQPGEVATISVNYTVKCEGVTRELYENCQKHLPSQLMASGALYDGYITAVEQTPYYEMAGDGAWAVNPERVNLYFTVEATVPQKAVQTTEIAKQEVRVGKSDYILKSEYIEFKDAIITDVTWGE